jgi:hypothetical protein
MDVDSRQKPAELVYHARGKRRSALVQPMRDPVQKHGVKSGITEHDFQAALGGRILVKDGIDLFPYDVKHAFSRYYLVDSSGCPGDAALSKNDLQSGKEGSDPFQQLWLRMGPIELGERVLQLEAHHEPDRQCDQQYLRGHQRFQYVAAWLLLRLAAVPKIEKDKIEPHSQQGNQLKHLLTHLSMIGSDSIFL